MSGSGTIPWRQDFAPGNWDQDEWELYNLDKDFSEANNLAAENPEKLEELKKLGNVTVVAPATEQSAVGHSITLMQPLLVQEVFLPESHS